jgi:large subunit ribosomal protein L11
MLKSLIRLQVKAQSATSGPPLGPALGQFGVPTMEFCKRFNDASKEYEKGVLINTMVQVKMDRTYEIKLKGPMVSDLLKKAIELDKGLSYSGYSSNINVLLTNYMLYEVYILSEQICPRTYGYYKTIKGSAQSCGFIILNYENV